MFENNSLFQQKTSKGDSLKHTLFLTFHRILNDANMPERLSQILIIFQFLQLVSMVVNDSNPILLKIIDKDILKYCHIPVIYPYFLTSSIGKISFSNNGLLANPQKMVFRLKWDLAARISQIPKNFSCNCPNSTNLRRGAKILIQNLFLKNLQKIW